MATTTLTPLGISGKPYNFTAKASSAGEHDPGWITELGINGWTSKRHNFFTAKASSAGEHDPGWITELGINGWTSKRHNFLAKEAIEPPQVGVGGGWLAYKHIAEREAKKRKSLLREEEDIMAIITAFLHTRRH